jgi:signal transduction histidine kinase
VAHDFNNLLTVIVGNLELLEKRIQGNERAQDRLDRAISAAFSGQALTQQLLAFSRRQSLNPVVIDVNTLLNGMSQLYESLGEDVEVTFDLAEDLPPSELDPILLETALLNIGINARDAMPEGGKLHFQTTLAVFEKTRHGGVTELPPGKYISLAGNCLPSVRSVLYDEA